MEDEIESNFLHAARIWFIREGIDPEQAAFYARHLMGNARNYASIAGSQGRLRELEEEPTA